MTKEFDWEQYFKMGATGYNVVIPKNGIARTKEWFELAVPNTTDKSRSVQLAVHIEEFAEMLDATGIFGTYAESVHNLSNSIKENPLTADDLSEFDRKELLDAMIDQIVTSVGVCHMFGLDVLGAMEEVNRSNFSKFVDGKPIFNEQGKIQKGKDYFRPDLDRFL